jgi:integrase
MQTKETKHFSRQKQVATLPPPRSGYWIYWDAKQPGLGVRITANGARSYIFESRVHGATVRTTIGKVKAWTLAKAQAEARRLAVDCVDKGVDPRDVAAAERARAEERRIEAQRQAHEFGGVWAAYVAANKARWGERHAHDHERLAHAGGAVKKKQGGKGRTLAGPLASLMGLKLSELSAAHITSWLKRESAERPTSAAQSYRLLRAFIRWCNEEPDEGQPDYRGIIPTNAYSAQKVRDAVPESKTKEGDCLQREQLAAWFKAVRALPNRVIATYLQALLLTGARREELLGLKWTDVNLQLAPSLTIRDKIEGKRTIPLTPFVASLLSALPRKNKWVFYSEESESGRLMEPTKAHNDALESAGLPHITLHGLRRSFATLAEWAEVPEGAMMQIQGHKPHGVREKNYKRRQLDQLRPLHEKLEAWALNEAGVQFVPLPAGRLGVGAADGSVRATA